MELADLTTRHAIAYRDRGIVGVGLGGLEAQHPPEAFALFFQRARDAGLGSVPHAGEVAGPASIRGALDVLHADRLRHGIRASEDPTLVQELAAHPLPALVAAGVRCSLSTDDPAMFDTDLEREYAAAGTLGVAPRALYEDGVAGALCDAPTRQRLRDLGAAFDWATATNS